MIKVKISKKNKSIKALEIRGHAEYAEHGKDIVCAAVSFLAFNTIDTFTDLLDMKNDISYEVGKNVIRLQVKEGLAPEKERDSQLILNKFELGMKSLLAEYGDFVRVDYMEV